MPTSGVRKSGRPTSPTAPQFASGLIASGAFRDCLPAAVGHFSAAKEIRCYPLWQVEQTTSCDANLSPSDQVFLDICCRVPGPRPSFQALLPPGIVSLPPYDYGMTLDRL